MSLKAKVEAIIYATEEPVTLNELAAVLQDSVCAELQAEEEARLALNEIISDGPPEPEDESLDDPFLSEDVEESAGAETAQPATVAADTRLEAEQPKPGSKDLKQAEAKEELKRVRSRLIVIIDELTADYSSRDRGMEIRQIAGGYRMGTKPEHHDVVVSFAKSLKPPVRLSLQALETLAVIAYKQPITVPEISEIRGVDSAGVIATLLDRKLVTTGGRKQVIGRPILYKTSREFLLRFGLKDVAELPSMEEFEKLGDPQAELFDAANAPTATSAAAPSDDQRVSEAGPEANPGQSWTGDKNVFHDGAYVSEAEPVMEAAADEESEVKRQVAENADSSGSEADMPEPVTEAVPKISHHSLVGESSMPADGTFATEAEYETESPSAESPAEESQEKS